MALGARELRRRRPIARVIVEALGANWARPLDAECRNFKWAARCDEIHRHLTLIETYLPEYLEGDRRRVLDVSAGAGVFLEIMRYAGHEIVGTELTRFDFMRAQNVPHIGHDLNAGPLPFAAQSFDLVTIFAALKQVDPERRAAVFQDLFRIARRTVVVRLNHGPFMRTEAPRLLGAPPAPWLVDRLDTVTWKYQWSPL